MVRPFLPIPLILFAALLFAVEAGPPKPKKVRCKDKLFTNCYKKDLYCPTSCPRSCVVDCVSCQPTCIPPPPPPPKAKKPKKGSPPPPPGVVYPPPPPPPSTPIPGTPYVPPPDSEVAGEKRVRCKNKAYPQCYAQEHTCPRDCPNTCEVDCVTCSPICNCNKPGAVCQDPRFIGADGLTFYFHGKKERDFCIVSDSNVHINAHFIGKRNENMTRDFTWVQSLGILFDNNQLLVGAKKTSKWDNSIDRLDLVYNGNKISLPETEGSKWEPTEGDRVLISRTKDTNSVTIEVKGNFQIKATIVPITEKESKIHDYGIVAEEDCFAHLDMSFKFYSLSGDVNGVLGQTYGSKYVSRVKMGIDMPVLGGDKEFASSGLFSTDCQVARFDGVGSTSSTTSSNFEFAHLKCASGLDGRGGVVCKR
ncbi:hypothetical protein Leryth_017753 [Lithospermum erythrorhizon]|nr:hypothetical protein Leryth_017753 [Lithospermum erythrorhizon]